MVNDIKSTVITSLFIFVPKEASKNVKQSLGRLLQNEDNCNNMIMPFVRKNSPFLNDFEKRYSTQT